MDSFPKFEDECFFIAPIGTAGSEERKRSDGVLKVIVNPAARELRLQAVRGDDIAQPGNITTQVVNHVLKARVAVADLTGRNPNVYYELAIRDTARLPVALIADKDERLPFDIIQQRTIFFDHTDLESVDECRTRLVEHLQSCLAGSVDSPVVTAIDVASLASGGQVERTLADVARRVEGLSAMTSNMLGLTEASVQRRMSGGVFDVEPLIKTLTALGLHAMRGGDSQTAKTVEQVLDRAYRLRQALEEGPWGALWWEPPVRGLESHAEED